MPNADAVMIFSCEERKAAISRAARLLQCSRGTAEEREFEMLTQAILEYDLIQHAQPIEIPPGFMRYIHGPGRLPSARMGL